MARTARHRARARSRRAPGARLHRRKTLAVLVPRPALLAAVNVSPSGFLPGPSPSSTLLHRAARAGMVICKAATAEPLQHPPTPGVGSRIHPQSGSPPQAHSRARRSLPVPPTRVEGKCHPSVFPITLIIRHHAGRCEQHQLYGSVSRLNANSSLAQDVSSRGCPTP